MFNRRELLHLTAGVAAVGLAPVVGVRAETTSFTVKVLGDPDAPVEIREYSSLTCPHCATWHNETLPTLKETYIDSGQVKLVYRDFPLNLQSWLASAVAHCAGDENFFAFLSVLFAEQARWSSAPTNRAARARLEESGLPQLWIDAGRNAEEVESLLSVAGTVNALVDLAQFGGLAPEHTTRCLADFDLLDWILEAQQEGRERFGVQATPTIVVDGRVLEGARSAEAMSREIEAALAAR